VSLTAAPPSPPPLIDQLQQRVPRVPVTLILVAANLLVFALMLTQGAGLWHSASAVQLDWGANFGPATKDGEWWRLGSALFLHFGLLHLGMNMFSLWDSGRLAERMYGSTRFVLIYFCSGLTGNLLSLITQGDRAVSGGASGAIFGVYGALMVFLWRERRSLHPAEFKWLFWGAVGFSVVTIVLGLQVTGIDNAAHIGGLLAGILAGAALARPLAAGAMAGRGRWLSGAVLALSLTLLITHIPAPRYRWSEEVLARGEINEFIGEDARLSARWSAILGRARKENASFDEVAGRIESEVSSPYAQSFEQLSKLRLDATAPSAAALEKLRSYAELRRDASRELVKGLRAKDPVRIREALEMATRKAPQNANGKKPADTSAAP
jgi:rhomboid protease GluP